VVKYKNIETLVVGSITYTEDTSAKTYYNASEKAAYLYAGGSVPSNHSIFGFVYSGADVLTIKGSPGNDTINLNVARDPGGSSGCNATICAKSFNISMGDGNDTLNSAKLANDDSVDMGAGDDTVSVMATSPLTLSTINLTKLDGGAGSDTLKLDESGTYTGEVTLNIAGATNFENLSGTSGAETIKGDANANTLRGGRGNVADTLYGYAGNDTLYGYGIDSDSYNQGTGAKTLYGGAGDDTLYGGAGEDTLDGGTGKDTLTGGDGVDTFVIRSGDGSTTLADADVVTDFTDGTDVIGLDNGLTFAELTISQGTGDYASHTLVRFGAEYLLILQNISVTSITSPDFTPVSIDESLH